VVTISNPAAASIGSNSQRKVLIHGVAGVDRVGGRPGVLIAQEPRLHTLEVRHPGRGGSFAQRLQHGR
jgi:hypothetical protein